MYNRIFILFIFALHSALGINEQKTSKIKYSKKLIIPKLIGDCKKIQCPTQDDPVCVKIKFNRTESANKTLYIIMINKCEMEYTKCHQGLEADVVPMKYCKHETASKIGKRRFKREIEATLPRVSSSASSSEEHLTEAYRVTKARRSQSRSSLPRPAKKLNETKLKTAKKVKTKKVEVKKIEAEKDQPKKVQTQEDQAKKVKTQEVQPKIVQPQKVQPKVKREGDESSDNQSGNVNNVETDHELSDNANDVEDQVRITDHIGVSDNVKINEELSDNNHSEEEKVDSHNQDELSDKEVDDISEQNDKSADGDAEDDNIEGDNEDKDDHDEVPPENDEMENPEINESHQDGAKIIEDTHTEGEDDGVDEAAPSKEVEKDEGDKKNDASIKEPDDACPTQCPARDVMVCAKCQHDVYKTFSSVCHMRLFSCAHPEEDLQLMSRYPCILSAPYLETEDMQPIGRVSEPNDEDIILKYIKCRQRAKESVPNMNLGHHGIPQIPLDCNFDSKSKLGGPRRSTRPELPSKIDYSHEHYSYYE